MPTVPVATLTNPTPAANALFGYSVAVSGTRVMVGAHGAGNVYAYELVNTPPSAVVPVLVATLTSPNSGTNDVFGYSVAISGTRAVVGAYHHEIDEAGMPGGGSTYIYDLASATPGEPVTTLYNPMPAVDDRFGYSVAVSDTRILVGAPNDDTGATDTGSAYVYDLARSTNNTIVSHPLVQFGPLQINNGFIRSMIRGLTGQGTITVETSIDLIEWHPIQTNTIAGETFELVTPISPGRSHQFFRALVMY